ncbi:flagellar hook-associated protein 3 [Borrelia miyamotoi]|uniref:Flagellar hook-associated protein 3 n=1 Tax=Borrelia miyamotoi TaxID=47466 RepID=A0AAP8YS11_9SPIR|nr:flagellar hook-associated protein 3 [Borrelia miyamotoi]ATQ15010.1 flagellar hook-associated protein 3 [Borrelia miyamotoi]ATQ16192.1 flagellar hook-associated protein 3 [Borrelia miyamotoi]ATQ17338.1 flagellar hook-associated protein 3 [Borrelia miyamotoi]ATQ18158.1 flagellar hook-associated protein 3 [Borrelia miyamotoi]ATQ19832.1 flagellar hook-associated protein 3 [Borrelia miyamotoi]
MINRVSHPLTYDNFKASSTDKEAKITKLVESLYQGGKKITNLRDDPTGINHAIRLDSEIFKLNTYAKNINSTKSKLRYVEGYLQSLASILTRAKEITVQGASGTYEANDKKIIAKEINAILEDVFAIANVKGADGYSIFAGTKIDAEAFKATRENRINRITRDRAETQIIKVDYNGDQGKKTTEIYKKIYDPTNYPGSEVFFLQNHHIISSKNVNGFIVKENTKIYVDNIEIALTAGDTASDIISKINESSASVEATLDPILNSIAIKTTTPHQIWITEEGSTVLQDLGILTQNNDNKTPPYNISNNAEVINRTIFDSLIELRDNLEENREELIGSRNLAEIDESLNKILTTLADLGAKENRLDLNYARISKEIIDMKDDMVKYTDLDVTKAITDLNMTSLAYQISLGVSARIMQTTLLDFLK